MTPRPVRLPPPPRPVRRIEPSDRRRDTIPRAMTVCIAASSAKLKRIVTVSDKRIETQTASIDDAITKWHASPMGWHCLFSGNDISRFESVWGRVHKTLAAEVTQTRQPVELDHVVDAIENAYRAELRHMAEVAVLNPWTTDLPAFESSGRQIFGDVVFQEMHAKITALNTGLELLVFGFENDRPHILHVSNRGVVDDKGVPGFGAIGSGQYHAEDFLYNNKDFIDSEDIGFITYRLCEAKFASENAPGVGQHTSVAVFGPVKPFTMDLFVSPQTFEDRQLRKARALWRRRRHSKVPEKVLESLRLGHNLSWLSFYALNFVLAKLSEHYSTNKHRLEKHRWSGGISDDGWARVNAAIEEVRDSNEILKDEVDKVLPHARTDPSFIVSESMEVAVTRLVKAQFAVAELCKDLGAPED
jgi:hypothetical protein